MNLIDLDTEVIEDNDDDIANGAKPVDATEELETMNENGKETYGLNPEDVELYSAAFDDFDQKSDGNISTRVCISSGSLPIINQYQNVMAIAKISLSDLFFHHGTCFLP